MSGIALGAVRRDAEDSPDATDRFWRAFAIVAVSSLRDDVEEGRARTTYEQEAYYIEPDLHEVKRLYDGAGALPSLDEDSLVGAFDA